MNVSNHEANWQQIVIQLKEIAAKKGITQEQIAAKTGLIQSNVSRIFALRFIPKLSTIVLIALALDVEITIQEQ